MECLVGCLHRANDHPRWSIKARELRFSLYLWQVSFVGLLAILISLMQPHTDFKGKKEKWGKKKGKKLDCFLYSLLSLSGFIFELPERNKLRRALKKRFYSSYWANVMTETSEQHPRGLFCCELLLHKHTYVAGSFLSLCALWRRLDLLPLLYPLSSVHGQKMLAMLYSAWNYSHRICCPAAISIGQNWLEQPFPAFGITMSIWLCLVFMHALCWQHLCSFKERVEQEEDWEVILIIATRVNTVSSSTLPSSPGNWNAARS